MSAYKHNIAFFIDICDDFRHGVTSHANRFGIQEVASKTSPYLYKLKNVKFFEIELRFPVQLESQEKWLQLVFYMTIS